MLRLGLCLLNILKENKKKATQNLEEGVEDIDLVDSLRSLEASSGLSYPILQLISVGKKNPVHTTVTTIAESLRMSLSEFFSYYDVITKDEIKAFKKELEKRRAERGNRK